MFLLACPAKFGLLGPRMHMHIRFTNCYRTPISKHSSIIRAILPTILLLLLLQQLLILHTKHGLWLAESLSTLYVRTSSSTLDGPPFCLGLAVLGLACPRATSDCISNASAAYSRLTHPVGFQNTHRRIYKMGWLFDNQGIPPNPILFDRLISKSYDCTIEVVTAIILMRSIIIPSPFQRGGQLTWLPVFSFVRYVQVHTPPRILRALSNIY